MKKNNKPFYHQLRKLVDLHILIDEGKGDSSEADAIRDTMDEPFRDMDERTIQACRNFSVYMYQVLEFNNPRRTKKTRWTRPFRDSSGRRPLDVTVSCPGCKQKANVRLRGVCKCPTS